MSYPYNTPFNKNLTNAQMQENAKYLAQLMTNRGWSLNAICAVLGNWQSECRLNPNDPEYSGYPSNSGGGFGLPQWTPWYRKYGVWCKNNGIANIATDDNPAADFTNQLNYHDYECINGYITANGQNSPTWLNRGGYSYTWSAFKIATDDVQEMAKAYYWQYERSGAGTPGNRPAQALAWYQFLQGTTPDPDPQPGYQQGGYIILAISNVTISNITNIDNVTMRGVSPERPNDYEIDIITGFRKQFSITITVTGLQANIYKKPDADSNYLIVDHRIYNNVPQPSKVEIYTDYNFNVENLNIVQNGNSFTITGETTGKKGYYANCGIYLWYAGSITYGSETLTTQTPNDYNSTELAIYFDIPPAKKRKHFLFSLKQRRYY